MSIASQSARSAFVIRVAPDPREGLREFVLRLSGLNDYSTSFQVMQWVRTSLMLGKETAAINIAEMTGASRESISRILFALNGPYVPAVPGFCLSNWALSRFPRICPECVEEFGMLYSIWNVGLCTGCPIHGRRLQTRCGSCGEVLQWNRPAMDVCGCRSNLLKPGSRLGSEERDLMALIFHAWDPSIAIGLTDVNSELSNLDLVELIYLIRSTAIPPEECRSPKAFMRHLRTVGSAERSAGVLAQWPHGFRRFLSEVRTFDPHVQHQSMHKSFGPLMKAVMWDSGWKDFPPKVKKLILSEVASVAGDALTLANAPEPLRIVEPSERDWITLAETQRILGVGLAQLKKALEKSAIRTLTIWRGKSPRTLLLRVDVESYVAAWNYHERRSTRRAQANFDIQEAVARQLGVNKDTLRALSESALIQTKPSRSVVMYSVSDANSIVARIRQLCGVLPEGTETMSFRHAATRCRMMSVADFVLAVLGSKIRVTLGSPDAQGLQQFLLESAGVAKVASDSAAHVSFDHCAKILCVKPWVVSALVNHRLIGTISVKSQSGSHRMEVVLETVRAFCSRFVLTNALARMLGRTTKTVEGILNASGVSCDLRLAPFLGVYELEAALAGLGTEDRPTYLSPWIGIGVSRKRVPAFSDGIG
jgi:hypothetical protein